MSNASPLQHFTLDNGLAVYLREDHRSSLVSAQLWYHVGSSQEPTGQSGLCHLVEHLMFEGSSKLGPGQYDEVVYRLGGDPNAFTTVDATCFPVTLPASRLEVALEAMADAMVSATLGENVFSRELDVVKAERRQKVDNRPQERARERARILACSHTPYANPTLGLLADLEHLDSADVRNWYQSWYHPNNASLVVVGGVDMLTLRSLVERHFQGIASASLPKRPGPIPNHSSAHRSQTITLPGLPQGAILAFNTPSLATAANPAHVQALRLIAQLLANGSSSRLLLRRVRGDECLLQAEADYAHAQRGDSLLTIELLANPANASARSAATAVLEEIEALRRAAPTENELQRAKNQLLADLVFARDNIEKQALAIGELAACGIDPALLDQEYQCIQSITGETLREAAHTYLTRERLTITYLGTPGLAAPPTDDSTSKPPALTALPAADEDGANFTGPAVQAWQTEEGATARLVESHQLPMIDLILSFNAGSRLDGDKPGLAAMTLFMLDEGTLELDAGQFAEHLEQLGARYTKQITRDQAIIHLRCLSNDTLKPALDLIIDMVARPALKPAEFELLRNQLPDSNRRREAAPEEKAKQTAFSLAFGDHPYASPTRGTNAGIKAMALDDVKQFHQKAYSANNLEFSMVGDITREAAEAFCRRLCAALPQHWAAGEPPALPLLQAAAEAVEQPGLNQAVLMLFPMSAHPTDTDYPALVLANTVLGGSSDSRLFKALRQRHGLTYAVDSGLEPNAGLLYIYGEVAAQSLDTFTQQVSMVLETYAVEGPSAQELELARQAMLGERRRTLASNKSLVELLAEQIKHGLPSDALTTHTKDLQTITPEAARAAFKLRLDLQRKVQVSVGPKVEQQSFPNTGTTDQ